MVSMRPIAPRSSVAGGIYYDRVPFDVAVDEKLKISNPTYTINFAPQGVAPVPVRSPSRIRISPRTLPHSTRWFRRLERASSG